MKVNRNERSSLKRHFRDGMTGFLFTLPFVIGFIFFIFSPFAMYVVMSFSKMALNNDGAMVFYHVGLENYINTLFKQQNFFQKLASSLGDFAVRCPAIIFFSLFIAILLNQKFKGRAFMRAVFFLPVLICSGAALMFSNDALSGEYFKMLSSDTDGTVNLSQYVISVLGGTEESPLLDIVSTLMDKLYDIICASGVQILIYLAGLQSISPQLYEASSVEGCTAWESFWKITLPMISPMILVNAVYTVIDVLCNPLNAVINTLYSLAMESGNYGLSAAMGLLYFAIIFAILGVVFFVLNRFVFYEDRR